MEWCPAKKMWGHGQLDVFWVLPLPKVYSSQELFYLSDARGLNFLCQLNTGLAGQKKANKNCMKFGVGWGWVAGVSLLIWPLLHERGSWTSASPLCILEKLIWQKYKPSVWREIHETAETREADHPPCFKEGNVKSSNSLFPLCSFKI